MKIIAVNAGSSSLKFTLYDMPKEEVLISGVFEKIGLNDSFYTIKLNDEKIKKEKVVNNHEEAVNVLLEELINFKIIKALDEIEGIGHRIVHGGDYSKSTIIDNDLIKKIEEFIPLAPLHNPANLIGIEAFNNVLPEVLKVGVFDTAFHQTMDQSSYIYPVPYEWYTDYKVRRYGFHGTSHKYISERISEILKKDDLKIITCHIGNGSSITAIKDGKCIDTTMGFTPNDGLMMGTRSGVIDNGIIPYMMNNLNCSIDDINDILNKKSGLLGVSGISSDHRDIEIGIKNNNERCILANDILIKRIVSYISQFNTLLNGADVICFAAGLGENCIELRSEVLEKLKCLGIEIDQDKNNCRSIEQIITRDSSKIKAYVIPTDEEVMIARDTYSLIS